jgi:hypothetical protein
MADFTDLDWAFTCPPSVTDEDLRTGYEVLVARFRAEGAHLPLNTAFQLKIERTISFYIKVKFAERRQYKQPGGFEHAGQEKDANVQLNAMLDGISEMLKRHHPSADRELVLEQVKNVILEALREVPDSGVRDDLARRFAVKFEQHGF